MKVLERQSINTLWLFSTSTGETSWNLVLLFAILVGSFNFCLASFYFDEEGWGEVKSSIYLLSVFKEGTLILRTDGWLGLIYERDFEEIRVWKYENFSRSWKDGLRLGSIWRQLLMRSLISQLRSLRKSSSLSGFSNPFLIS